MKNAILFFIFGLFFSFNANACLNEYGIDSAGHVHRDIRGSQLVFKNVEKAFLLNRLKILETSLAQNSTNELLNDYAVNILKIGKTKEALNIFKKLIFNNPKEYNFLANIGTAYELNGQVDSALKYISLAFSINPLSHEESEWVHINILKAKLNTANNFPILSIINFDNSILKDSLNNKKRLMPLLVQKQIEVQLFERLPFTPRNDIYVGQLCKELADMLFVNVSMSRAYFYYKLAIYYDKNLESNLDIKLNYIKLKLKENKGHFGFSSYGSLSTYKHMFSAFKKEFKKDVPLIVSDYEVKFQ